MGYILAIHVPIAGVALLTVLLGWPLLLTPMLIALLELIIDPACSVVLEAEPAEPDVMRRPPRDPRSHLLSGSLLSWAVLQGAVALAAVMLLLNVVERRGMPEDEVRALAFVMLVGVNIALIFVNRTLSRTLLASFARSNRALSVGLAIVAALLAIVFGWPGARAFFALGPVHGGDLALCAVILVCMLLVLQLTRLAWRERLER
jgi:Ca2+-transporting ATPase